MPNTKTDTKVEQVSSDELDNLLGMPGGDVAMTGTPEEEKKSTFFDNNKPDMTFLDEESKADDDDSDNDSNDKDKGEGDEEEKKDEGSFEDLVEQIDSEEDEDKKKSGRAKLDKTGMAQLTQALIDDELILPFEGEDKDLSDYTVDEFKELFKLNIEEKERAIREATPKEFFEALPEELQYAARYVAEGGNDLKGLFKHLSAVEETKSLSIENEAGQEEIVRQYLKATNFGDDAEIQEEIESWKDLGRLETQAGKFKPKLDKMQEKIVEQRVKEQEEKRKAQEAASQQYAENIYKALEPGELNGLKMNNKTQNMLYQGLIQPNYTAANGARTNLFGHLIEKHQFVEPNHELIAEALWLLADPDGYKKEVSRIAKNAHAEETARKLKTEEASKGSSGHSDEEEQETRRISKRGIQKPSKNFFARGNK